MNGSRRIRHLALVVLCSLGTLPVAHALPDLLDYGFSATDSKLIPGSSDSCSGAIAAVDQLGALALVARPHTDGNCYNRASYANSNYLVEHGTISDGSGVSSFPAFRVHEPQNKATSFVAAKHAIYYRFPTSEDYTIYLFEDGMINKVAEVPAAQTDPAAFVPVPLTSPLIVSGILGEATYVFAPSSARISVYTELAPGVEGARISSTPFGDVLKYRYSVPDTPFDTRADYTSGPGVWGNRYSDKRRFFLVTDASGNLGVVWQDQSDSSIQLTWFGSDLISPNTVSLANPGAWQLAAATGDAGGNVYFLTIESGNSGDGVTSRSASLTKADSAGATLTSVPLDTTSSGFKLYEFSNFPNGAALKYLDGKLGLILGRTMLRSGDGLNHQGAIGVVFNGNTLAVERNWGQTSGHSFESVLTCNSQNEFVGIDLGDNYPRGVHLHKFTATAKQSRVVSSFKTRHGTTGTSPAGAPYPEYTEISTPETTFYQWSNDNNTYTELGGVAETALGYSVSFIGEPNSAGHLLDNSRAGSYLNDSRNVGLVTVLEHFEGASNIDAMVVTNGPTETGGFYTFNGTWSTLSNAGVVWLTNYASTDENASRLKMSTRADGSLLLLWELWTANNYITTRGMTVDPNGTIINPETDLGNRVRLHRRDDPMSMGDAVYLVTGDKTEGLVEVTVFSNAATPLDAWRSQHFSAQDLVDSGLESTIWGPLADPDHDGCLNLVEYGKGTDPNDASDCSEGVSIKVHNDDGEDHLLLVVRQRNDPDLVFVVEISTDLQNWAPIPTPPVLSGDLGGEFAGFVDATYRDPDPISSHPQRYVRVRVTQN